MSGAGRVVAVTGATGFLGRHAVAELAARGWQVRALVRSQPIHPLWKDLEPEIVLGALGDTGALRRLVTGADAVLHIAGLIKARDEAEFMAVNRDGTARSREGRTHVVDGTARVPRGSRSCPTRVALMFRGFREGRAHVSSLLRGSRSCFEGRWLPPQPSTLSENGG